MVQVAQHMGDIRYLYDGWPYITRHCPPTPLTLLTREDVVIIERPVEQMQGRGVPVLIGRQQVVQ